MFLQKYKGQKSNCPLSIILYLVLFYIKFLTIQLANVWITPAFIKSINNDPTIGIIKKAFTDGPLAVVNVSIFAIAFGVAPKPNPQCPVDITAAS